MGKMVGEAVNIATGGMVDGRMAAVAEKRARREEAKLAKLNARRQVIKQRNEARIATANVKVSSVSSGVSGGSSAIALEENITQQLASNLHFLDVADSITQQRNIFLEKAAHHRGEQAAAQGFMNLIGTASSIGGSVGGPAPAPKA